MRTVTLSDYDRAQRAYNDRLDELRDLLNESGLSVKQAQKILNKVTDVQRAAREAEELRRDTWEAAAEWEHARGLSEAGR
jgi:hypothetical protein